MISWRAPVIQRPVAAANLDADGLRARADLLLGERQLLAAPLREHVPLPAQVDHRPVDVRGERVARHEEREVDRALRGRERDLSAEHGRANRRAWLRLDAPHLDAADPEQVEDRRARLRDGQQRAGDGERGERGHEPPSAHGTVEPCQHARREVGLVRERDRERAKLVLEVHRSTS